MSSDGWLAITIIGIVLAISLSSIFGGPSTSDAIYACKNACASQGGMRSYEDNKCVCKQ